MTRRVDLAALPWHPVILAAYPVLLLYTRNADNLPPAEALGPLAATLAATALVWLGLARTQLGNQRAALIVTGLVAATFTFERNVYALSVRGIGPSADAREGIVLLGELAALGGGIALLARRPGLVPFAHSAANAGSLALLAFLAPGLVAALTAKVPARPPSWPEAGRSVSATPVAKSPDRADPDIYFLVLDAYGRSDILRSAIGWDNRAFLDRMVARGFFLADRSTSNYCQTALSVAATLDGTYHDALAGADSRSRRPLRDLIRDNATLRIVRERGYRVVGFATGYGVTDAFGADTRLAPGLDLSEFGGLLLGTTPFGTLTGRGAGRLAHAQHRGRILFTLDHLPEVADDPAPTFCLAHILAPHPPFVFDRSGGDRSASEATFHLTDGLGWGASGGHGGPDDYAQRYREQAAYLSDRVEAAVDAILARSKRPPVIVIQGDHGPGSRFDTDGPQPNDLSERMGILNLILLPGGSAQLDRAMTPVNTFRIVADHLFGTALGRLPDRNYYSPFSTPYRLTDVTEAVRPTLPPP